MGAWEKSSILMECNRKSPSKDDISIPEIYENSNI